MHTNTRFTLAPVIALGASVLIGPVARAHSMDEADGRDSHFRIGAGAAYVPRYEGASDNKVRALPLRNYRNGRFFAGALGGIGHDFTPSKSLSFGPLLSYRFGRDEDDADRLRGLGDPDGGLDAGAFVRWNLQPIFLHATVKRGITGDGKGTQIRFGAGYRAQLTTADALVFDVSGDWANSSVMQANFGLDAGQSVRSGLPRYDAKSGIRCYGASLICTHAISTPWFTTVGATVYRLGNEAGDSPIVERRTVPV